MPVDDSDNLPKRSRGDIGYSLAKAAISGLPIAGGSAAELFTLFFAPPIEKRRDEWFERLHERLRMLEQQESVPLADLVNSDAFVSANLKAARIALSTHEELKLAALRNAVVNVASKKSMTEEAEAFFFRLIDEFTATHIQVLQLFGNRSGFPAERRVELENRRSLTDPVVLELNARGLLEDPRPFIARNREGYHALVVDGWELSSLGAEFLKFITERPSGDAASD
jgi:hypothetical protein